MATGAFRQSDRAHRRAHANEVFGRVQVVVANLTVQLGAGNLLTPERRLSALLSIQTGAL
jgi:hypothetical protein